MTADELHAYLTVKGVYPNAFVHKETTYGKAELYTIYDPVRGEFVGPTSFSEDSAWRHAAARLERE